MLFGISNPHITTATTTTVRQQEYENSSPVGSCSIRLHIQKHRGRDSMLNVLSVDVEDYFQVEAFASQIRYDQWDSFTPRVERNVKCILELFAKHGVTGTFFVLGWVAKRFPRLVR